MLSEKTLLLSFFISVCSRNILKFMIYDDSCIKFERSFRINISIFCLKKSFTKELLTIFQPSYKMQNLPLKEFFSIRALSVKSPAKTGIGTLSSTLIKEISAHFPTTEYSFNYHSLILSLYRTFIILRTCFETFFLLSSVFFPPREEKKRHISSRDGQTSRVSNRKDR